MSGDRPTLSCSNQFRTVIQTSVIDQAFCHSKHLLQLAA
ncbi:Uncharacterised protein [Vibrio cholerae]|nr:Uncharacterised protein [Vibrio cholerae]CSI48453.1 Uncharacterised protein [Vibrio cholerae]